MCDYYPLSLAQGFTYKNQVKSPGSFQKHQSSNFKSGWVLRGGGMPPQDLDLSSTSNSWMLFMVAPGINDEVDDARKGDDIRERANVRK